MSAVPHTDFVPGQPGARFDPYVRLVRSLLPRTSCVSMFGPAGELMWSTDPMTGPDLMNIVDDAMLAARANADSAGQMRLLGDHQPVYLCPLRDDAGQLLVLLAVMCRQNDARDKRHHDFSFAYSLLAPAIECLRRDLISHAAIEELTTTVGGLDKNLNLLLTQGAAEGAAGADGANELQQLLQQTIEHLRATTGALLVPEKNVTLVRAAGGGTPDTQFLMRAHRRLLTLAQGQREPLLLNETQSPINPDGFPHRVLCCSLRSRTGRFIGVLALLRDANAEAFNERDAHIAEIIARKAIGVVESSYDALSGLYTRAALERRVRALVAEMKPTQPWSALYIDVDQLHAINEKSGMHVGDGLLAQLGELIRQRLPPGAFGARISGDRFAVCCRRRSTTPNALPSRCAKAAPALRWSRRKGACRSRSASASRRSIPPPRSWRTCSPPPRAPARPPRTAAATASRSTRRAMSASCAASPTSASRSSCARRSTRAGCTSTRSSSCRSPPPRAHARTTSCCCA